MRLLLTVSSLLLFGCGGGNSSAPGVDTYVAGKFCFGNAIDSNGDIWVANMGYGIPGTGPDNSNVIKLSPDGKILGTYVAGVVPIGLAIDKSGNVWVENYGKGTQGTAPGDSNITKLAPDGTVIGTYPTGSY